MEVEDDVRSIGGRARKIRVHAQLSPELGEGSDCEPHVTHLLPGERELLVDCHRRGVYLALCGVVLPVAELESSLCEPGCEREITYCVKCLHDAAKTNADAGLGGLAPEMTGW